MLLNMSMDHLTKTLTLSLGIQWVILDWSSDEQRLIDLNNYCHSQSNRNYRDFFSETWNAFTDRPLLKLADYANKRVQEDKTFTCNVITTSSSLCYSSSDVFHRCCISVTSSYAWRSILQYLYCWVTLVVLYSLLYTLSSLSFSIKAPHCTSSGLMAAFSKHLISRLHIYQTNSQVRSCKKN